MERRVPLAWPKARAMQHWINRSGIAYTLPTPFNGPQLGVGT